MWLAVGLTAWFLVVRVRQRVTLVEPGTKSEATKLPRAPRSFSAGAALAADGREESAAVPVSTTGTLVVRVPASLKVFHISIFN